MHDRPLIPRPHPPPPSSRSPGFTALSAAPPEAPTSSASPSHSQTPPLSYPRASLPLRRLALPLLLLIIAFAAHMILRRHPPLLDEPHHFGQIAQFLAGNWSLRPELTVLPTWHALIALTMKTLGLSSLNAARTLALLTSLTTLAVFCLCLRALNQPHPALRTLQLFFLPFLFPYLFLVYTDPPALLFLLLAFLAFHHRRYHLAALAASLSMLIRQTHALWLAMFLFMLVWRENPSLQPLPQLLQRTLRHGWLFLLGLLGFFVFWILNHGTALGDRPHHPEGFFGFPNLIFFFLAAAALFFPLLLARQQHLLTLLRRHLLTSILCLFLLALLVLFFFYPTHPYNEPRIYIRNCLLYLAVDLWYRALLILPAALGILCLLALPLHERWMYLLYPFLAIFLTAHSLVESRYLLPGLTLLLLSRPAFPLWLEQTLTAYWALLSTISFVGLATKTFYP